MVIVRVPVALVVPRPVQIVILVHRVTHVVHLVERVVLRAVLLIELLEALLSVKVTTSLIFLPVALELSQEVVIVPIVLHPLPYLLLKFLALYRSILGTCLALLLPVFVLVLILEVRACLFVGARPEDQPIVLLAQV